MKNAAADGSKPPMSLRSNQDEEQDRQDIYSDLENKMAARILKENLAGKVMAPIGKASVLFELTMFPGLDVFGKPAVRMPWGVKILCGIGNDLRP
jgi:hypothetical protein